jgi:predicted DNA-binding protein (MmcQ/YjbR family)
MSAPADVPPEILDRLRPICLGLPEAYEEPAWIGTRWRIRGRTFAHVYTVDAECRLTFRSPGDEIEGLVAGGHPFAKADWGDNVIRMELDGDVDWTEVGELLTESYLLLAPKRLAARVDRPPG